MAEFDPDYTDFAPPQRVSREVLNEQYKFFKNYIETNSIIDAFNEFFLILNDKRQSVYANKSLLRFLNVADIRDILGKRPGEILSCTFALNTINGCGTAVFCRTCGAVEAILNSLNGIEDIKECSVINTNLDAIDLRVWTKPFSVNKGNFSLFVFDDISNEKRKDVLERTFFHDIMNTVGGIRSLSELLFENPDNTKEYSNLIMKLSNTLIDEINSQKLLLSAERNELHVTNSKLNSIAFIKELVEIYENHEVSVGKLIVIDKSTEDFEFTSDKTILMRALGNMLKNALETTENNHIILGAKITNKSYIFQVNSMSYIPEEISLQIFKRSFSTKPKLRNRIFSIA